MEVNNSSSSETVSPPYLENLYLLLFLLTFCIATVFGNILVVLAVLREKTLHSATNFFITSLAIADGLVGFVVMPFSATYEAMGQKWIFGPDLCDIWHSLDVLASTASILNLCVISLDRYWAITDPISYPCKMSHKKAGMLILLVWVLSSAISFPAIAWWRATATEPPAMYECKFTEDTGFLVFSSIVSFYGPLTVMVFAYVKIYKAAVEHTRSIKHGQKTLSGANGSGVVTTLRIHRGGGAASSQAPVSRGSRTAHAAAATAAIAASHGQRLIQSCGLSNGGPSGIHSNHHTTTGANNGNAHSTPKASNFSLSKKLSKFAKEKKAAKTLGTVMGVFIICWLPFFLTNVISGICPKCIYSPVVFQVVTWLGWINSGMNPVIYACFSRDFRRAFVSLLCVCFSRSSGSRGGDSSRSFQLDDDLPPIMHESRIKRLRKFCMTKCCCSSSSASNSSMFSVGKLKAFKKESYGEVDLRFADAFAQTSTTSLISSAFKGNRRQEPQRSSGSTISFYSIPPPNYKFDPNRSQEKLV